MTTSFSSPRQKRQFCSSAPDAEMSTDLSLCSPRQPYRGCDDKSGNQKWVDYALENEAILLLDNAYEAFITSDDVPRSIFELPGAKECAIEFRSFSKSAGFTGLRCAYTILPHTVKARMSSGKVSLHPFWMRRQATKFNGVAYPIQKGAEAVYSAQGQKRREPKSPSTLPRLNS